MNIADFDIFSHILFPVKSHLKGELLQHILALPERGKVIVCTRTRLKARSLAVQLAREGFKAVSLEGHPAAVDPPESRFESGTADILVLYEAATEEVPPGKISHIIYYDMPYTPGNYFRLPGHLLSGLDSCTIYSLVSAESSGAVASLVMVLEQDLERRILPDFDYDTSARQHVNTDSGISRARRSGLRQTASQETSGRGYLKHRSMHSVSSRDRAEDTRKVVGSRSETTGANRQQRSRPEARTGRSAGSSRQWMEKESRVKTTAVRKGGGGDTRSAHRPAKPSSQAEPPLRKAPRRSIFGITAPMEPDED